MSLSLVPTKECAVTVRAVKLMILIMSNNSYISYLLNFIQYYEMPSVSMRKSGSSTFLTDIMEENESDQIATGNFIVNTKFLKIIYWLAIDEHVLTQSSLFTEIYKHGLYMHIYER